MQTTQQQRTIEILHARVNNLKNVSVSIPRNTLTVISGVSGSGKSSLAFDTLYAEGQRRFVESLSAYARQFLERKTKPDVESITGLPPAIAIEQKTLTRNPRSTVGTTTEVYDYLRLLYGRIGTTLCKHCGREVRKDSPQVIHEDVMQWNEGDRIYILFALPKGGGSLKEELQRVLADGYSRVMINGTFSIVDLQDEELPQGTSLSDVMVVTDRLILQKDEDTRTRLFDSIDQTFKRGGGRMIIRNVTTGVSHTYSNKFECAYDNTEYQEPDPKIFSFNSPVGACQVCQGFGRSIGIDEDLVIPDRSLTIRQGATMPFKQLYSMPYLRYQTEAALRKGVPVDTPVAQFTQEQYDWLWNGDETYGGINAFFKELEDKSYKVQNRVMLAKYRGYTRCTTCGGSRLRTSARQVYVGGKNIPALVALTLEEALEFFQQLKLSEYQEHVAGQLLKEIRWRLQLLVDIGVGYLTLDRLAHTLSGGESQRLNLATSIGSSLVGTLYVLDEPSIGLHPRDTNRLITIMKKLRNLGNTVVVVEHDPDIIRSADRLIDVGPQAGEHGGEIIFNGTVSEVMDHPASITGKYLSHRKRIEIPTSRRKGNGSKLTVVGANENNIKNLTVEIPLGCITVVTGVSGSGKSSLIHDVLYANLKRHFGGFSGTVGRCAEITGINSISDVEMVDQSPIGRSSRSTPVTYTKAFDSIREVFSNTQSAKQLGWKPGHFSFNVQGGRCEACEGSGTQVIEMQFLPDIELECEVCRGSRYKKEALGIHFKGKNIVEVLAMTIDEAAEFFKGNKKVTDRLRILQEVGLGYLRMGQSSSVLSGGEAQRIKLATHLDDSGTKGKLFIFDEPTTGLHFDDVAKLIHCFNTLVENGNSVVIIEHNMNVISCADWIIDLGPDAGSRGGEIVAVGTPEKLAKVKGSFTAEALRQVFEEYDSFAQSRTTPAEKPAKKVAKKAAKKSTKSNE